MDDAHNHAQDMGAVKTPFGTVTPKRGSSSKHSSLQDVLDGAILCTPDGRQYGFTNMSNLNDGIGKQLFPPSAASSPIHGNTFATLACSPFGDWALDSALPTIQDNLLGVRYFSCVLFASLNLS